MADHADDGANDVDVFVYMGGSVPHHLRDTITHVRVHKSVKIIAARAFLNCERLVSIEMHDGVEIIEQCAFAVCSSLRRIKLPGVRVIEYDAFNTCTALADIEFGDKLETIGRDSFVGTALRNVKIPKVRVIDEGAFHSCKQITDVELSEDLEAIHDEAFGECPRLRHIAMPLKDIMFDIEVFKNCDDLSQVDLVGGIHKTISSLLLESWRSEMKDEIDRINRDLPITPSNSNSKTDAIRQWMVRVLERIEHYKSEHYRLLKEFTTLLELALWKAKLDEEFGEASNNDNSTAKKVKIDTQAVRKEQRITSGASIVIKNVLPFLKLE
jgi:hypothetical protein